MENLARHRASPDASEVAQTVLNELERCGIPAEPQQASERTSEVPYKHIGKLGPFTFTRAWRDRAGPFHC